MIKSREKELEKSDGKHDRGLTSSEARKRFETYGPNALTSKKGTSALKIIVSQFTDFMVMVLLAATAISIFMGEMTEAITIIAIVILNAILGFVQEFRTEKTLEALKNLAAPTAKIIRDGELVVIPADAIVPGDLMVLEAGDRVSGDGDIVWESNLYVDESLLTGESVPTEKRAVTNKDNIASGNRVYMGTVVTSGRAKAVVTSTGMLTEMGKIADMIQSIEEEETPLQRKLDHLGKFIVLGCIIICVIVTITGILRGEPVFTMLLAGISLAVAAIPEGLPAVVTIALALGVQRMLKRNALIRRLPAVETLGCANVICSDKTGTLTQNRMTVRKIYAGEESFEVVGDSDSTNGGYEVNNRRIEALKNKSLALALEIGTLCNDASLVTNKSDSSYLQRIKNIATKSEKYTFSGDPTEGAILIAAAKAGIMKSKLDSEYRRIDEIPFDSDRKCMSVVCANPKGDMSVYSKGAPDVIIQKCTKVLTNRGVGELTPTLRKQILKNNEFMANEALRVIGVAYKAIPQGVFDKNRLETDLIFVGLIGMIDPPRPEAMLAVTRCRLAGIKPVMITGDHRLTATAIAKEIGIFSEGDMVLTGEELDKMSVEELEGIAEGVSVYARVSPKHKLMIVSALKSKGNIVAMTGDGVNDAPAVKEADIGVSMGITGTDVTKEASAMILMDDNFATIVSAVEEGRVIYSNIRKFIRYLLSCNIGEVLTMFLGMMLGMPLPLLPVHILLVNLVTDGLPAMALGVDPADDDIMQRRPRGSRDNIFSNGLLNLILFRGIFIGLCTLAVFTSILYFTSNLAAARTGALVTLVATQLIHVFECKSEFKSIFEIRLFNNIPLILAVSCSLITILSVVYVPALARIFNTVPLTLTEWCLIAGFSAFGPILSSFVKPNAKYRN